VGKEESPMRWPDWYLVLMAAILVFGLSVSWAAGAPGAVQLGFLGGAVLLVVLAARRAAQTRKVAVVGMRRGDRLFGVEMALDDAGFAPRWCLGPQRRPCPVLHGDTCPLGGNPVAAVVYVPYGQVGSLPPCGPALGVPVLTVSEDANWSPAVGESDACIPWAQGAAATAGAVQTMLVRREQQDAA
jgi:hypothetical protein